MNRFFRGYLIAMLLAIAATPAPATAEEPAHVTYVPPPPGTVVTNQLAYLTGEAMHSQWRAVLSRAQAGTWQGAPTYQWYLSMYAIDGDTYRLKYRSPGNGGPFERLTMSGDQVTSGMLLRDASIVGTAELMQPGVQQLIVQWSPVAADCGSNTIVVFSATTSGKVVPAVSLENACALTATIVPGSGSALDSLRLSGPYYGENSGTCCPTKQKASATLLYRNGAWIQTPKYYPIAVGKFNP